MPRIFDNISEKLLTALQNTMQSADRADFCVGYFNLRGWRLLQADIDQLSGGEKSSCRILIGMNPTPRDELREYFSLKAHKPIDQQQVMRRKRQIVEGFRRQLTFGAPNNEDEQGLRDLVRQLRSGKVTVKLFLRDSLHAKLYLIHREDYTVPTAAFLGSSNLTLAGLSKQGELNTEVSDYNACQQLKQWFEERWDDRWCLDITEELIEVIDNSWARKKTLTPYELYLKIAYHLAQEARAGLNEFKLPHEFAEQLLDYQAAAVRIAARHLNTRDGVLLGDVVGLGKTLMATALARIFQDDQSWDTLIICPPNLVRMWEKYRDDYRLTAKVVSLGMVTRELPDLRRYRIVIIDESHNLRNRETQRYRAVHNYISTNESRCILLSATPYNKSYLDLSAQLRLFIGEEDVLRIRPEQYLKTVGEAKFQQQFQAHPRSIVAFEKSEYTDDWRDLMRLYLVRRTRSFIENNYAETDQESGRRFMELYNGERFYFPHRVPKTVSLKASPQYQRLYSDQVVELVNNLSLPRYGLGQYVDDDEAETATAGEKQQIENLSRAGKRLMGFCRTNLFKRLESSGVSFLQSVDRHIVRNYVFLHAIENDLDLPIGSLDAHILDPDTQDEDSDSDFVALHLDNDTDSAAVDAVDVDENYAQRAQAAYALFNGRYIRRFKWLRASLFTDALRKELQEDIDRLTAVIEFRGDWNVAEDTKLAALHELISREHSGEKVLVFSQFADTIRYLQDKLTYMGTAELEAATGQHDNPTALAQRFSPVSNELKRKPANEIRVLLSTDVLSEGQNLQDSAIVINYDLPWAIIRLSQRAGRVDRIGQKAEEIRCYSFLPAEGVDEIIRLRSRVRQRLEENGEVVGSDEQFFEDDKHAQQLRDLYTEKSGILDLEADSEVDLSSYAYQEWANATKENPRLKKKIEDLPDVVYSSQHYQGSVDRPQGVITYVKSSDGTDALVWLDKEAEIVTESQLAILRAAKCDPDTPPQARHPLHHDLVLAGVQKTQEEDYIAATGGQLGRPNSTRRKTYERLKHYVEVLRADMPIFGVPDGLEAAIDDIYRHPLLESARDRLNRQLRASISDEDLADLVIGLWQDDRLSRKQEGDEEREPRILCSMGLFDLSGE